MDWVLSILAIKNTAPSPTHMYEEVVGGNIEMNKAIPELCNVYINWQLF